LGSLNLSSFGIITVNALLQIFGILSWCKQEVRKWQNQELRADLAWSINSGSIESRPGDFLGFRYLKVAASCFGLKEPEILFPSGVQTSHRSDSSLLTSLVDLQLPVLCALIFMSCEAMEYADMQHRREQHPDLPVRLLMVLHALQLDCKKLMELTASSHCSCFFCSI